MFSASQLDQFQRDGYVIVRGLAPPALAQTLLAAARADLECRATPLEYEADLHYPGAPASKAAPGGATVRRLLLAYNRADAFRKWSTGPVVATCLRQLLGPQVALVQAHHNCIMTKQPHFSSDTLWHQDMRYWAFARPDLISVWLALGTEQPENGCLRLLPGTHRMNFAPERLDAQCFLRLDHPENKALLAAEVVAKLAPGDVLFFHALTFHAATRNRTEETKFSLVFTYRAADNTPLADSRSASLPDIPLEA
jgi:phytanoyl-CoA hydroxylase